MSELKKQDELKALLEDISDSYPDFVNFGIGVADTDEKRKQLIEYLQSNPDANTSQIISYIDDVLDPETEDEE